MSLLPLLILTLSLLLSHLSPSSSSTLPDRFFKSIPSSLRQNASQEYFELTKPLPSDQLTPSCSVLLLDYSVGNTVGLPPLSVPYSPPSDCLAPWSHVVLEITATCQGEQYDRIAGVWLGGAEILRTSTAEPTEDGIFWKVRKDVTRYTSLLSQSNLNLSVKLENVVDDVFTGVYYVNVSLLYYNDTGVRAPLSEIPIRNKLSRKLMSGSDLKKTVNLVDEESELGFSDGEFEFESEKLEYNEAGDYINSQIGSSDLYETPADLIIPLSNIGDEGFWFRIQSESDESSTEIQIPPNTWKAVLEVYVSYHGDDEFWYSNPPDTYIRINNLTTSRGNGAFREVFVTIDGSYIGSVVPFPVIFTGGVNPLLWEPVVSIGAFNLPSYDFDLTPFLGLLLDGKAHIFGLRVADSIPFWLVDANLHLWLDQNSSAIEAQPIDYNNPAISIKRKSKFHQLDGSFKIGAKRQTKFSGWVKSSSGNITTEISQQLKFKNQISFQNNGTIKTVKQKVQTQFEVMTRSETGNLISRLIVKRKYPLYITTSTLPGIENSTYMMITNVSHSLKEKFSDGQFLSTVYNSQDSGGWMIVQDHSVLSGGSNTNQSLSYRDGIGCWGRSVVTLDGVLVADNSTSVCTNSS